MLKFDNFYFFKTRNKEKTKEKLKFKNDKMISSKIAIIMIFKSNKSEY